jgi:hypothetical protein
MKTIIHLYLTKSGSARITKGLGTVQQGELPIRLSIDVPDQNWKAPPIANVDVTFPTFIPMEPIGVQVKGEMLE